MSDERKPRANWMGDNDDDGDTVVYSASAGAMAVMTVFDRSAPPYRWRVEGIDGLATDTAETVDLAKIAAEDKALELLEAASAELRTK